ncbi:MAG: glycosyltransferase family 4 protein [Candidatus Brocadia sp.]|nr:glycosyltransferase family 4 protein [Candidatus Brocadia sp.]
MQVTISVGGVFHAFYLTQQLLKQGYLNKLITSYPKFEAAKYGIPKEKIKSILLKEILHRGWSKLPQFCKNLYNPQFFISDLYDKLAAKKLEKCDIFVGFSSFSLHSLRKAKKFGSITIIERGSSHIVYQNEILKEECEIFGVKPQLAHPKIIEKELQEYEEADYISIPSTFVKKTFLEKGIPESKLIQVPYGVDLFQFRQIPKNDDVYRVVFAGGMTLQKGVHYLLRAFSELNLSNSELILLGGITDEIKPFFKKYQGQFKYIGAVSQKELASYYSQSSVFVLNSIQDGFGMVIIQAMACGLAVIATTNTGAENIVRNGIDGFIIPIRDVEALKEKLLYLYENPEICRQMGQSAKKRVSNAFSWDDYGNKYVNFLNTIQNKRAFKN